MDCLFCKIAAGAIPVDRLFEDDRVLAFPDINPQAPTHVLVIPKRHIGSHAEAAAGDSGLVGHIFWVAGEVARQKKLGHGYRMVVNTGPDGGQTVEHLHIHLLGGRPMLWPPG
jgi:histidine triad (HIT) family protein